MLSFLTLDEKIEIISRKTTVREIYQLLKKNNRDIDINIKNEKINKEMAILKILSYYDKSLLDLILQNLEGRITEQDIYILVLNLEEIVLFDNDDQKLTFISENNQIEICFDTPNNDKAKLYFTKDKLYGFRNKSYDIQKLNISKSLIGNSNPIDRYILIFYERNKYDKPLKRYVFLKDKLYMKF